MAKCDYSNIVYTSADDAKSSLTHITDVLLLRRALRFVKQRKEKTKALYIERRLRQLARGKKLGVRNC